MNSHHQQFVREPETIAFHEEIYTSAQQLLDGGSHLGIVARSRGFPMQLEPFLQDIRGYTFLDGLSLDQAELHPPRLIVGRVDSGETHFVVSQTVYRGADHTGRTTPLAHHLIFDIDQLRSVGASVAGTLRSALELLRRDWKEEPAWIDPPRSASILPYPTVLSCFPSRIWTESEGCDASILLSAIAEHLLSFQQIQKMVVICLPLSIGVQAGQLIADVLACLPPSRQFETLCISHVIESCDLVRNAALCLTYPGTPFLNACRSRQDKRAPVIIDLCNTEMRPASELGAYAALLRNQIASKDAPRRMSFLLNLYDQLGIAGSTDASHLVRAVEARERILHIRKLQDLEGVAQVLMALTGSLPTSITCVEQWCMQLFERTIPQLPLQERWAVCAGIGVDPRWPQAVRERVLRDIIDHDSEAFSVLLNGAHEREFLGQLLHILGNRQREIIHKWISRLDHNNSENEAANAVIILRLTFSSIGKRPYQDWIDWASAICNLDAHHKQNVLDNFSDQLRNELSDIHKLEQFHTLAVIESGEHESFMRLFYLPFLQSSIADVSRLPKAQRVAWLMLDLGLRFGVVNEVITWLRENTRLVNDSNLREWRTIAGKNGLIQQLQQALCESGVSVLHSRDPSDMEQMEVKPPRSRIPENPNYTRVTRISWCLALFVILLQAFNSLHWFGPPFDQFSLRTEPNRVPFRAMHLVCFVALGYWICSEVFLRCIRKITPLTRMIVPTVRYTVALALISAIVVSLLRIIWPFVFN